MKRIRTWLTKFFFPPAGTHWWLRALPYAVLGVLTIIVLISGAYAWEYTNSSVFCGTTCHTMPPEYTAYQSSPHANVTCVECHIGRGFVGSQLTMKAGHIRFIFDMIFHNYEYPIMATELSPARVTCEKCHFPESFSADSLVQINHYGNDKNNTLTSIYLILKTGGGSERLGLGRGIHWHIENKVMYYPTDSLEQTIPFIQVTNTDGSIDNFVDTSTGFDPSTVDVSKLKEMDCITCHNRVTHIVNTPETSMDNALTQRIIDPTIPDIYQKGVEVLTASYTSQAEGLNGIAGLTGYYQAYYPDYYTSNQALVQKAIKSIQDIYTQSVFFDQKLDWTTHPNNVGHMDTAGCFRCHDGKHFNANQQAVRLECNLCHSIPAVAESQQFITNIEISRGPEPTTHFNSNWIAMHRNVLDSTCSNCHTTTNPGGTDNSSFCSNSACHGNVWKYAGFDAPALRAIIESQLPPTPTPQPLPVGSALTYNATIGPLFTSRCGSCHGTNGIMGLNLTTYASTMAGSSNGPVILPGNPDGSLLVQKQSGTQPHFGQLTSEELKLVVQWILAGAPEN